MNQIRVKNDSIDMRLFVVILLLIMSGINLISAQSAHQFRRDGDKSYTQGQYNEAEEHYRKSLAEDPKMKGYFNLGNSLFQQQRYEEAREQYDKAIARTDDPIVQGKAYYNKGNSFFSEQKLNESVEMYKQALRKNPEDKQALQNLLLTKQLIREQQKQQQQQSQQDQNKQKDQEQQDQKQKQDQEKQNEQDERDNDEKQEQQQEDQQQQEMPVDSTGADSLQNRQITKEELMKLMKAIEEEDKAIQKKLRRGSGKKTRSEKDW
jgi:tetratricopeptide (TPR) repeat protein